MVNRKGAADRKVDIVDALLVLADRIGPDRLTTNDVARTVGVTQAAIFRHFPSKDELWAAAGEALEARLIAAWEEAAASAADPETRVRALVEAQLAQIERTPALPAILHSRELGVSNGALRDSCNRLVIGFRDRLAGNLEAMAEAGALRPDLDPGDGAMLLVSLVQGLAIRWTLGVRNFSLPAEGMRMLDVQLGLFSGPASSHAPCSRPLQDSGGSGSAQGRTDPADARPDRRPERHGS